MQCMRLILPFQTHWPLLFLPSFELGAGQGATVTCRHVCSVCALRTQSAAAQAKYRYPKDGACLGKLPSTALTLTPSCDLIPTARAQTCPGLRAGAHPGAYRHRGTSTGQPGLRRRGPGDETATRELPVPRQTPGTRPRAPGEAAQGSNLSFPFTHQSRSTSVGLKPEKRKRDKLIKDSETRSLSLILSSRLPGFFFSLPNALCCQQTKFRGACELLPFLAGCPHGQSPTSSSGAHAPYRLQEESLQ